MNHQRIRDLITSLQQVANLPDPSRKSLMTQELNNGLVIEKVTNPLGVVGIIYESSADPRPYHFIAAGSQSPGSQQKKPDDPGVEQRAGN